MKRKRGRNGKKSRRFRRKSKAMNLPVLLGTRVRSQ